MKVLNFGSCNIDYVYSVDHIVVPGETQPGKSLELFAGGKGLNQSIALARAGVPVYHAGAVGADGAMLRDTLSQNGVDITFLCEAERSGHAIIQLSAKGENSILLYPGANATLSEEYIDEVLSHFGAGDVMLLQNETNLVPYIIDQAAARGLRVLFNPAPFTPDLADLDYRKVHWLVLNEIEAAGLGGKQTPEENMQSIRRKYPTTAVVMTLGGDGSMYADADTAFTHPAFSVEVVDTTAAGDTFIGYFLASTVNGKSPKEAVCAATAAAALAVSKKGAAPSIPYAAQLAAARKHLKAASCVVTRRRQMEDKINAYFTDHLCDANLEELSLALGYSKTYTGELVRRVMQTSFSELIQQRRAAAAAQLLRDTELSVGEIIARVGYRNESFFRTVFKQIYGLSPYQYKKAKGETV